MDNRSVERPHSRIDRAFASWARYIAQMPDTFDPTTRAILHVLRTSMGLVVTTEQITQTGSDPKWRFSATRGHESWTAVHEDPYGAVVALAELAGMDLEA